MAYELSYGAYGAGEIVGYTNIVIYQNVNKESLEAWTNSKYCELVFPSSKSSYYLSTRSVSGSSTQVSFGLQCVDRTSQRDWINVSSLVYATEDNYSYYEISFRMRPLIKIPLTSCKLTKSTTIGMDYDITPK
ncbi:MAG: hypothetical protein HFJ52_04690 [Clostridia bacterium]|nr:hypothetical protein [Clostridia bacterium]